jgi:hypothetical protein
MGHLVDEILCALFHEMDVPFKLSSEELKLIEDFLADSYYKYRYGNISIPQFASNDLRRFVAGKFVEKEQGSDLKFVLLSSHDSTLSMLLSALGLP